MYFLRKIWSPELFQGAYKSKAYFEGWYYKIISKDHENIYAVIPGIAIGQNGQEAHAFVQVINGKTGRTVYFKYPLTSFAYNKKRFDISIAENHFSQERIFLNLKNAEMKICGELQFDSIISFPKTLFNPGIMGPYSFVPMMECYHSIINISHKINGDLVIDGSKVNFSAGEGYLEKDYGKSFPREWIWVQANHFDEKSTCFMFSIARIPWLGSHFTGIICFLLVDGRLYRFATYNGVRLEQISLEEKVITARLTRKDEILEFSAAGGSGGFLKAPKNGLMTEQIEESITASVEVRLSNSQGLIFSGRSTNGGMELSENASRLIKPV